MPECKIVMIDDDVKFIQGYQKILQSDYQVYGASTIQEGFEIIKREKPDVLLLDISLKTKKEGLQVLPVVKKAFPGLPVIIVTNWDSHAIFQEAINLGADDFFIKSDSLENLKLIIQHQILTNFKDTDSENAFPLAYSSAFQEVLKKARQVAPKQITVMLTGETGTGKEVVANYIHDHSRRAEGPFVSVNCGALPDTLIESELFGYEKGAFTGATSSKMGKFEVANGGTIFLDEIEALSMKAQATLLHVTQNSEITRLGSNKPIPVDVRIICASNQDLKNLLKEGIFRDDLYYRLAVFEISIPPLRDREEDIIPLCLYFLEKFMIEHQTSPKVFTRSALRMLKNYHWPGNVRELKNLMERLVVSHKGKYIRPVDIQSSLFEEKETDVCYELAKKHSMEKFQREYIKRALVRNSGNISQTARDIGISRQALQKILADLNLDIHSDELNL